MSTISNNLAAAKQAIRDAEETLNEQSCELDVLRTFCDSLAKALVMQGEPIDRVLARVMEIQKQLIRLRIALGVANLSDENAVEWARKFVEFPGELASILEIEETAMPDVAHAVKELQATFWSALQRLDTLRAERDAIACEAKSLRIERDALRAEVVALWDAIDNAPCAACEDQPITGPTAFALDRARAEAKQANEALADLQAERDAARADAKAANDAYMDKERAWPRAVYEEAERQNVALVERVQEHDRKWVEAMAILGMEGDLQGPEDVLVELRRREAECADCEWRGLGQHAREREAEIKRRSTIGNAVRPVIATGTGPVAMPPAPGEIGQTEPDPKDFAGWQNVVKRHSRIVSKLLDDNRWMRERLQGVDALRKRIEELEERIGDNK